MIAENGDTAPSSLHSTWVKVSVTSLYAYNTITVSRLAPVPTEVSIFAFPESGATKLYQTSPSVPSVLPQLPKGVSLEGVAPIKVPNVLLHTVFTVSISAFAKSLFAGGGGGDPIQISNEVVCPGVSVQE